MRNVINGKIEVFDNELTFSFFNDLAINKKVIDYEVLSNHFIVPVDTSTPVQITFKMQVGTRLLRLIMTSPVEKIGSKYILEELSFHAKDEDIDAVESIYLLEDLIKEVLPAGVDFSITADITQEVYIDTRY